MPEKHPADPAIHRKPAQRGRILPESGAFFVHVMSRVVNRDFILGPEEKAHFRKLMRQQAEFSGLQIVTYAIMDNHFHILLHVPEREALDDAEIIRRLEISSGRDAAIGYRQMIDLFLARGQKKAAAEYREKVLIRMYDLSAYMQQLKRLFTRWYNRRNARKGTLWEERYKSVLVQGAGHPLLAMAAYIDLNPVRAGIVDDPKDYVYSGYGEAVGGSKQARAGLTVIAERLGRSTEWRMVQRTYRQLLYGAGEANPDGGSRRGFTREKVQQVWAEDGELHLADLLRCRVRYFTDTVAFGSRAYAEEIFEQQRGYFSEVRPTGARKFQGLNELFGLRDLRVDVVS
jgi:putative transposase